MPRRERKRRKGPKHAIGAPVERPVDVEEEEGFWERSEDAEEDGSPLDGTDDATRSEGSSVPRSRRTALRKRRRKRAATRMGIGTVAGILVVVALVATPLIVVRQRNQEDENRSRAGAAAEKPITMLVFGTREKKADTDPQALWMMLFSYDARNDQAAAVEIPAHTAAEIPGRGLASLDSAYTSGGVPLLLVSVENLLGIRVDRYLELSDRDARVLFSKTGPITVDVPEDVRVPAGGKRVRIVFGSGSQRLSAPFLVRLLYTRGLEADDIDFGARHLAFWDGLFDRFDNDPAALSKAVQEAAGALAESDADANELARLFRSMVELPRVSFTLTSLPVRAVAAGKDELYSTDESELKSFVAATFGGARVARDEVRVQVLNGNGVPGIGQKASERLIGHGYRVILSGNARRLDYGKTLIVTYDRSDEGLALAERAKQLLGVGQVQVSAQQQGIVDLTIVIGKDFLNTL